ncbi:hypothetical protein GGR53DRAFT_492930 [Hypoxylon sp. FL1150]|nr:hypothetical protein GGR53DRAFT_492930 [Hypoxylon sp. FL1150]
MSSALHRRYRSRFSTSILLSPSVPCSVRRYTWPRPNVKMGVLFVTLGTTLLLLFSTTLYSGFCLFRNFLTARKLGVPVRIILVDHINPLWLVFDRPVLSLVKRLPFGLGNNSFTRYNFRGWEIPDRYYSHHEMGDAYILVSPRNIWLYLADPDAIVDLWRRGKEFPREVSVTGESFIGTQLCCS